MIYTTFGCSPRPRNNPGGSTLKFPTWNLESETKVNKIDGYKYTIVLDNEQR